MNKKKISVIILISLAISMLSIMHLHSTPGGDALRIGINTFPVTLNPVYATSETSQAIINKIYDSLFHFDSRGKLVNGLVETVQLNPNGKEILFQLKKKIFFSDGKELDAGDVVQTLALLKDKTFGYPYISDLGLVKKTEKVDRYRFKVTLSAKQASWKNRFTFKILNARQIARAVPAAFRTANLVGTGPYRIKAIEKPTRIILEKNCAAPANGVMYPYIEYIVVSYTHLMPLKLLNDEIDIGELQPEHARAYGNLDSWRRRFDILKYKKFGYTYLVFNLKNSAIDKNLRRHFYNQLVAGNFLERFLKGGGEKVITPFLLLDSQVTAAPLHTQPLAKPIRLKILTNSESKLRKEFVLFLRNYLKPLNIHLEPLFLEYRTFLDYLKKGNYDIAVSGYLLDIDYDMTDVFSSTSYFNYANFVNPKMDALLEQGLTELDPKKRTDIYLDAHRLWLEELPILPLFNLYYYVGVSRNIEVPGETYQLVSAVGDFLCNIKQWGLRKGNNRTSPHE